MDKIAFYLEEIDRLQINEPIMPITCELDPSNYCQNKCSFCISGDNLNANMMGFKLYSDILRQLSEGGIQSITFTGGGEPTLNDDFNAMARMAVENGFKIALISNGIRLNEVDVELFEFIRISLDAGQREAYMDLKRTDFFDMVIRNMRLVRSRCKTLGLSYVINGQHPLDIAKAEALAEDLAVDYIQFKPENGHYIDKPQLNSNLSLWTIREKESTELSCIIAGLVGIITADGRYVFCCQHRYDPEFTIANLHYESLEDAVKKRVHMQWDRDRTKCVSCRYTGYAKSYADLTISRNVFLRHKEFL